MKIAKKFELDERQQDRVIAMAGKTVRLLKLLNTSLDLPKKR
jgi:hypothetical protein